MHWTALHPRELGCAERDDLSIHSVAGGARYIDGGLAAVMTDRPRSDRQKSVPESKLEEVVRLTTAGSHPRIALESQRSLSVHRVCCQTDMAAPALRCGSRTASGIASRSEAILAWIRLKGIAIV